MRTAGRAKGIKTKNSIWGRQIMKTLDVNEVIEQARFGRFHWMVMSLCALLLIFDGYDLFIYGVVLPVLMDEWNLTPVQAGALGSYALFGMMFGAFVFGPLADKIGRKKGVTICFALFSLATFLNGFASSPTEFGVYRFLAGLGCGGLMPNAVALMNEYSPKRSRSTLVAIMFSGYSLGGLLSAAIGIYMLPRFGWQSMFFLCGHSVVAAAFYRLETARVAGVSDASGARGKSTPHCADLGS
jgi:AAHS family benzoate transporter-like MFS transporter